MYVNEFWEALFEALKHVLYFYILECLKNLDK